MICKHDVGGWCHNPKFDGQPQEECPFYNKSEDCDSFEKDSQFHGKARLEE